MPPIAQRQSTDAPRPAGLRVGLWPALAASALAPLSGWISGGMTPGGAILCGLLAAMTLLVTALAARPASEPAPDLQAVPPLPAVPGPTEPCAPLLRAILPAWIRHVESARSHAQHGMDHLARSFSALDDQLAAGSPSTAAQSLTEQILTDLQSQDRMGQMLGCVTDDMLRMQRWCEGAEDPESASAERWLSRLADTYPMEDMRSDHLRSAVAAKSPPVEFF